MTAIVVDLLHAVSREAVPEPLVSYRLAPGVPRDGQSRPFVPALAGDLFAEFSGGTEPVSVTLRTAGSRPLSFTLRPGERRRVPVAPGRRIDIRAADVRPFRPRAAVPGQARPVPDAVAQA